MEQTVAFKRKCHTALLIGAPEKKWKIAAVVPDSSRTLLPKPPEAYLFNEICVAGTVLEEKKKPYVLVTHAAQLEVTREAVPAFGMGAAWPCDEGVKLPTEPIEVKPAYTARAMRETVEGVVEVQAIVGADGTVSEARVIKSLHPDLDQSAVTATLAWRFTPGTKHGKPSPVVVNIEMTFVTGARR